MAAYPTAGKDRVAYWTRRIDHVAQRLKPVFDASNVLVKQYYNESTTQREDENSLDGEGHTSRIKANLIFGWIDQSIANLLERNPHFTASALNPESMEGARVVAAISNYWYRETEQLRQDERVLLDAFLRPYGVKKLGWTTDVDQRVFDIVNEPEFEFGDDIEQDVLALLTGQQTRVTKDQNHELHIEAKTNLLQNRDPEMLEEVVAVIEENLAAHKKMLDRPQPDVHTGIQWESPFGQRWRPDHFFLDPLAQDGLKDAQWIAFMSMRRIEDVKSNPNYKNTNGLEASTRPEDAPAFNARDGVDEDDFGLVTIYEVWARNFPMSGGRRRNHLFVFAEGHDKPLREDDEWPYTTIEDFPAEVVSLTNGPNEWYTKPVLTMAGGDNIQALTNEILDSVLYVVRKMKNVILYDPDVVESDTIDNILMSPDMSVHPVRGLSNSANPAVQVVNFGRVPSDRGNLLNLIQGLFDRAAGTPQPVAVSMDTATEASIHEKRTSAREARRGNLMAEFQTRTARKFWQMTTQFRPERMFMIHPQAEEWATVTPEIAMGEYRFTIDIGSQAQSVALERKQWQDLLNLFSGLAGLFQQLYGPEAMPNLQKLAERLLVRGYNEMSPEEILPALANVQGQDTNTIETQAAIQQMLAGTPGEAPTEGPTAGGPPTETETGARAGAAMPRQFREPAPSGARQEGQAQGP